MWSGSDVVASIGAPSEALWLAASRRSVRLQTFRTVEAGNGRIVVIERF